MDMQFLLRSIGRVGTDLPRLCRWSRWPAALARREAPLMSLTSALIQVCFVFMGLFLPPFVYDHNLDYNELYLSIYPFLSVYMSIRNAGSFDVDF